MKELNQEWRRQCMPIYIKAVTLVSIVVIIGCAIVCGIMGAYYYLGV